MKFYGTLNGMEGSANGFYYWQSDRQNTGRSEMST